MLHKSLTHRMRLVFLLMLSIPTMVWADREVNQPQFGKQVIEVGSDEVITFYDPWGTENIVDNNNYNAQSLTVFKPAEAGKSVQITFEEIDLNEYSTSYYLYMNLYDGVADADDTFQWPTTTSEISSSSSLSGLTGILLAEKINNKNKPSLPAAYTSSTADGALSVGFMHRNSNTCTGWVAKVKVVTLENMAITGAGSSYDGVGGVLGSKQNAPLANAYVTATGVMNPDPITGIHFTMAQNENAMNPLALKLFKGDQQVAATVETDGNGYKFVLNENPVDGTTTFTIKGDFLGTAIVGAKVQVDIVKVTTIKQPDGIVPFIKADNSVTVENPAIVLMSSTPQVITVGNTPIMFYDEGGLDGGIQSKTNGQVTFLSGVEGQKVMIDFKVNKIWHGSLYNQELRIYNGQEVDAEHLLKTLQQGETGMVRSTSADGSLTVVLYSDASNSVDADGFEAEVSLFTPQPMDFDGITTTAMSGTVTAGDTEQNMLNVNVKAKDTEPAMEVTKMSFTTVATNDLISKASLYYHDTKIGEAAIVADAFDMTLTKAQPLTEGDNVFTLKYDITDEALNNQTVTAKAVSVTATVNGLEKTVVIPDDSPVGSRTVYNIVLSHANQGTVTKMVNGSLAFETQKANEYSSSCEAGTDNRINVFVPKHEDMICQIDFSDFNVQYSSSNYGIKSIFKIYTGQDTTGDILWELNDNSQESVGSSKTIRSTAPDGSLTIVFNPNSSYYYYNGFKAIVSEYLSKDMELKTIEVTHPTTTDASIGAVNQDLLMVNMKTDGDKNSLSVSGMKVSLKGTESNIDNVSVWHNDTQLGQAAASAEVFVAFDEVVTLVEGDNSFIVKADISSEAEEGTTIDAALLAVYIDGNAVAVDNGDPEGSRTLKNQIFMTEGDHGQIDLSLGRKIDLFDDGGPENDGADGVTATVTLAPADDADCIKLTNQNISFAYTAHLYIYKGGEVNADNLIMDLTGSSAKFDPIISDADFDGGKLTIKYVGAGSYTRPNFAISAEGYKKTDVAITGITTEDISVSEVLKGQTDVKMLKVMVEAKGELTPANVTAFNLTGADEEIVDAMHIYQTGTVTSFSVNDEFTGNYTITQSGTYHFWIVYDIAPDAAIGQTAFATLNDVVVDGSSVEVTNPATATVSVASGKSGTYIVGNGGDYTTIQGAIDDMGALGMEGPVVLKVKAGNYTENVRIPYIKGMGAVNTLTIESESGLRDVKINHEVYNKGGYSDDQHEKAYGVVTLYEASHVTLRNLEICTSNTDYQAVVMVKDGSRHVTIDGCYLHAPTTTGTNDVVLVGHTIINEENKNNDYLTIRGCLLEGGKMGVSMGGTGYVALPKEMGGIIEGNTFKNNGTKSIYVMDELGAKIRNNTVIIDAEADTRISVGVLDIQLRDACDESTEITGNTFNLSPKTYGAAMYLRQMEGQTEAPVIVANNVVNLASLSASYGALEFSSTKVKNVYVANNTIRMTGAVGGAAFWVASKLDEGYGNIQVVNNIIQNETSGYAVNIYHDNNMGVDKIDFHNNLICTAGETFFRASSSTLGDFAAFEELTGAANNINKCVEFVSEEILMPSTTLDGDLMKAVALDYVVTDILGNVRPSENISIGAYEYAEDVLPQMAEGYPQVASVTDTSVYILVKADAMGKAFLLVRTANTDAPTLDELTASAQTTVLTANAEALMNIAELEPTTNYVAYVFLQSPAGQKGTECQSVSFKTLKTPAPAPEAELTVGETGETQTTIELGESATLHATILNGDAPYSIVWMDGKHNVLKEEEVMELPNEPLSLEVIPECHTDYLLTVTDSHGRIATATARVYTNSSEMLMADFENLFVPEQGYENGANLDGSFVSGSFEFANFYSDEYGGFWAWCAYANRTSTAFDGIEDQCNNVVGGGVNGSANYLVAYVSDWYGPCRITLKNNDEPAVIPGCYITNSTWVENAILNGDGISDNGMDKGFGEGDYLLLTIKGDNGNTLDYYLADYRSADASEHHYTNTWEWIDLSSLGAVKTLSFSMSGSKTGAWGLNTPTYFCIDDLGAEDPHHTTGIGNIDESTGAPTPSMSIYNLSGQRVNHPVKGGIYIINGRKIIMK